MSSERPEWLDNKNLEFIPIGDIIDPEPGLICTGPSYWITVKHESLGPEIHALRFMKTSWQCNSNEEIAKHLGNKLYPGSDVTFIRSAFLPHNCSDYY